MKYFGQLMFSFLFVVLSTILVVGVTFNIFSGNDKKNFIVHQTVLNTKKQAKNLYSSIQQNKETNNLAETAKQDYAKTDSNIVLYDLNGKPNDSNFKGKLDKTIIARIKNTGETFAEAKKSNNKIVLYTYYSLTNQTNKIIEYVRVKSTLNSAQYESNVLSEQLFISGLFAIIISTIISWLISRRISSRLLAIRRATKEVVKQNYEVKLPENNLDEIGMLSRDVNKMTRSLKWQHNKINEQEEKRKTIMANASHEMRTPLTVVSGFLEAIENDMIPQKDQKKYIYMIHDEIGRLSRLVKDSLDFERLRSNETILKITQFNATEVIENVIEQLSQRAKFKNDQLIFKGRKTILINADKDRFTQLAVNIITNSIQFTQNGKITITLSKVKNLVNFKVVDTGIGMTQDEIDNVYERYYKADKSRIKTEGESGLGMSIVREIIDIHDSTIGIKSIPDKGTETTIIFDNDKNKVQN